MENFKNEPINKISVVIICWNEEHNIGHCIHSCRKISNDIVVIDGFSNDKTVEIATSAGAKVHQKKWMGYGETKNYGIQLCNNDWILSIDADERLDEKAQNFLLRNKLNECEVYAFKRDNYIGDTIIRFGDWNPDVKIRIFQKSKASWDSELVHESLQFSERLKKIKLPGKLLHFSYNSIADLENKLDLYAKLSAKKLLEHKSSISIFHIYAKPVFRFIKSYIIKLGIFDGVLGYKIAVANSNAVKKRYLYLKEMLKNKT